MPNGRPQLSNISYSFDPALRTFKVSITDGRIKTRNLRNDPRASLYTTSPDGWAYTVADGSAALSPVAEDPQDDTVEELIEVYRLVTGSEHPDWDEYRHAMITDRRLVLTVSIDHVYGAPPR